MTDFSELVGLVLVKVGVNNDKNELTLHAANGDVYKLYHSQDCCESVEIESIVGDLNDLIGEKILRAEEVTSTDHPAEYKPPEYSAESFTWTFYKLATRKGYVDIRWYGSSNGYYSESVSFDVITYKSVRQKEIMTAIQADYEAETDQLKSLQAECAILGHDTSGGSQQCVICGWSV